MSLVSSTQHPAPGLRLPRWCQLGRCAPLGAARSKRSVPLAQHGMVTVAAAAARSRGWLR